MATFCTPGHIEKAIGSFDRIGELLKTLGGKKALVIMDAFLASPQVGLNSRAKTILDKMSIDSEFYTGIVGEPTSEQVEAGTALINSAKCDSVIAIGGGSAIDTAKAIAVKALNPDLAFSDIAKQSHLRRLALIAVPTTAGTGSEATRVSVITNLKTGIKENPGHPAMIPDIAVLDAGLMLTLPANMTAFTGMDALAHAMEAYVSNKANDLTDLFAYEAMKIIGSALPEAYANGLNETARQQMATASCFAGIAFSNSSTNLAHAGGRALGAKFHIPHGLSVALLLPFVMEFGLAAAEERYARVAVALGAEPGNDNASLAMQAVKIVYGYNDTFGVWAETKKKYIPDLNELKKAIPEMVKNALAGNGILTNPVIPNETDVERVFTGLAQKLAK